MISRIVLFLALLFVAPAHAQFLDQAQWGGTTAGTANAQTVTIQNVSSLADILGVPIWIVPGSTLNNSASATLSVTGTPATIIKKVGAGGLVALTGGELRAGYPSLVVYDGAEFFLPLSKQPPTRQNLTDSSGTYTTPTGATSIYVREIGGGGGGGGTGATGAAGGAGGTTSFGTINAAGGGAGNGAGAALSGVGGVGGSGGTGSGTTTTRYQGGYGFAGPAGGAGSNGVTGGGGCNSQFGGGGEGGIVSVQVAEPGVANSGSGGGAGGSGTSSFGGAGGGACGEYVETIIVGPAATYSFTNGAAGAAGAGNTQTGSIGGTGRIEVDEFYD